MNFPEWRSCIRAILVIKSEIHQLPLWRRDLRNRNSRSRIKHRFQVEDGSFGKNQGRPHSHSLTAANGDTNSVKEM